MKIYTKTGDKGETSLIGGERVSKTDARIETIGALDELNAHLGLTICALANAYPEITKIILKIQNHLFDIGAEIAGWSDQAPKLTALKIPTVTKTKVSWLESEIDKQSNNLSPLQNFILPGGTEAAAYLHVARTVCRRAERRALTLLAVKIGNPLVWCYLNRLSDLLFTLARAANAKANKPDVPWQAET